MLGVTRLSQTKLTIDVSEYLNFALFVKDASGLLWYQGYIGRDFRWPFGGGEFARHAGVRVHAEACHQWQAWWEQLVVLARKEVVNDSIPYDHIEDISTGKLKYLEQYPELQLAAQWSFPKYLGWWTLPYAGGKSALEAHINSSSQPLYQAWRNSQPTTDRVFMKVVYPFSFERMIEQVGTALTWGIIGPHDIRRTEWVTG